MNTQIWGHAVSGERFAVQVDESGTVVSAAGPLHHSDIEAVLSGFDSDENLVDDINNDTDNYVVVVQNYITVHLSTDEDTMCGSSGWGDYDERDSVAKFGEMVEQALCGAFPGVEINVATYAAKLTIDTDLADTEDSVKALVERVWNNWEWLVQK